MDLLPEHEISPMMADLTEWETDGTSLTRTYTFADFGGAMGFVTKVALAAEKADHHPDIDIRWNKVALSMSTHSAGGLTKKDFDLAAACDRLAVG